MPIKFLLPLVLLSLSACSNTKPVFIAQSATSPDQGMVYIYRPSSLSNIAISPPLEINQTQQLMVANNRHYSLPLPAGQHRFELKPGARYIGQHQVLQDIKAGEMVFLKVTTSIQFEKNKPYTRRFDLEEVSAEIAQTEISQTTLIEKEKEVTSHQSVKEPPEAGSESAEFSINKTRNPFSN